MKRCIVCGNTFDDKYSFCGVCGNPLVEITDDEEGAAAAAGETDDAAGQSGENIEEELRRSWAQMQDKDNVNASESVDTSHLEQEMSQGTPPEQKPQGAPDQISSEEASQEDNTEEKTSETDSTAEETPQDTTEKTADGTEETAQEQTETAQEQTEIKEQDNAAPQQNRRPRRMRSGPQIYGQESMGTYTGAQGVIRRDVNGSAANPQQMPQGGPVNGQQMPQGGPVNGQQMPQGGPMNGQQMPQGGPVNGQQMPQGGPMNGQQMPQGGPMNGQQMTQGAPMNRQQMPQSGPMYGQQGSQPGRVNHLMEKAQEIIRSPLLLIVAILSTLYLVGSVLAVFMRELNYSQISNLLSSIGWPSQLSSYVNLIRSALDSLDTGALVLNLLFRLPDLLFCIGLWIVCINVRTTERGMSGAGFTFMRINVILRLIGACLVLLVVLVLSVILTIATVSAGTSGLMAAAIVLLVVVIALTMAVIMYYFCYLATIRSLHVNAGKGEPCGKVSRYVAVIQIILALTSIVTILSGIINLEITGILSGVGRLFGMILFGAWILRYRNGMTDYEE